MFKQKRHGPRTPSPQVDQHKLITTEDMSKNQVKIIDQHNLIATEDMSENQVRIIESELKRTRRELENTKNVLKHQVARCRHLVSAFSKKLAQKDAELKLCKETREKQLGAVIRALLVLEARLRREQKSIRGMLADRDSIIARQQDEISRLHSDGQVGEGDSSLGELLAHKDALIQAQKEEIERLRVLLPEGNDSMEDEVKRLLAERDQVIKSQKEEIARLQEALLPHQESLTKIEELDEQLAPSIECYAKPDLISSLCIDGSDEKEESTESTEAACQPDSLSSDAASTRACLGDNDTDSLCNCTITPPVVRGSLSIHDRSAFSPVPRSSHKYEEPVHSSTLIFNQSDSSDSKADYSGSRFDSSDCNFYSSSPRMPMRTFDINYQDNPVLQCVNQILLKDPDDIMEDQRSNKLPSIESPFVEIDDADQPFWLTNGTEETKEEEPNQTLEESPKPAVATSSPLEKSINGQESEPAVTRGKLSLSKLIELHHAARRLFPARDGRKSVSMNDLTSALLMTRGHPPVPPKPRKSSGKRVEFAEPAVEPPPERAPDVAVFSNPKTLLPPQPVYIDRNKLDIISKPSPLPFAGPTSSGSEHKDDSELYVISNSALDDEILQKIKGKNLKSFEIKLHRLAGEAMMQQQARRQNLNMSDSRIHPGHKPTLNKAMLNNINLLEAAAMLRQLREAGQRRDSRQPGVSPAMSQKARLRVAASVAQLLAQAQQQAREQHMRAAQAAHVQAAQEAAQAHQPHAAHEQHSPSQAQSSKARSSQGTQALSGHTQPDQASVSEDTETLSQRLEAMQVEEAAGGSGESSSAPSSPCQEEVQGSPRDKSPGTYDNFLEATGLSQKSIMTPSRMLNNHRSVVKPKDVKLRNKVRNAAIFERTIPPQVVGPTIKYWTEPYL